MHIEVYKHIYMFYVLRSKVSFVVIAHSTNVSLHKWKYNGVVLLAL